MLEISIFFALALFMAGGAIAMILNKQTVFSAFAFLVSMIGLAGIFALLDSRFLAIAQIMVSVGAVVVLSTLTILTVNAKDENLPDEKHKYLWVIFSTILISPFTYLLYKTLSQLPDNFQKIQSIDSKMVGKVLFTEWVLPFEIISILLLTAMLGAIIIAKQNFKKKKKKKKKKIKQGEAI